MIGYDLLNTRRVAILGAALAMAVLGCFDEKRSEEKATKREEQEEPKEEQQAHREQQACRASEIWDGQACESKAKLIARVCKSSTACKRTVEKKLSILEKFRPKDRAKSQWLEAAVHRHAHLVQPTLENAKNIESICKTTFFEERICTSTESIVAFYDPHRATGILENASIVANLIGKRLDNTLIDCGSGRWATIKLASNHEITDEESKKLDDLCDDVKKNFNKRHMGELKGEMVGGGLSLDVRSGGHVFSDICGDALDLLPDSGKFTSETLSQLEKMHEACEGSSSLFGSMAAGTTSSCGEGCSQTRSDDGRSYTTTYTDSDGSITAEKTTFNPDGSSDHTTRTTYADTAQSTSSTHINSDGSATQNATYTNKDGLVTTQSTTVHPDGSGNSKTVNPDGSYTVDWWKKPESDGRSEGWSQDYNPPSSKRSITVSDPLSRPLETRLGEISLEPIPKGCASADPIQCSNCGSFEGLYEAVNLSCQGGPGSDPTLCSEFGAKASCCEGSTADPNLVIPDPNGNLVCSGPMKTGTKQELCERHCSIADQLNCVELCVSEFEAVAFDPLDGICPYANLEACWGTEPKVPEGGIDPTPGPMPFLLDRTALRSEHSVFLKSRLPDGPPQFDPAATPGRGAEGGTDPTKPTTR